MHYVKFCKMCIIYNWKLRHLSIPVKRYNHNKVITGKLLCFSIKKVLRYSMPHYIFKLLKYHNITKNCYKSIMSHLILIFYLHITCSICTVTEFNTSVQKHDIKSNNIILYIFRRIHIYEFGIKNQELCYIMKYFFIFSTLCYNISSLYEKNYFGKHVNQLSALYVINIRKIFSWIYSSFP